MQHRSNDYPSSFASGGNSYESPALKVHGTLATATGASLIGPIVDNNHSQGMLIIGNTSL